MDWLQAHPGILAAAIFLARLTDVSLSTVRTIIIFRGFRFTAAFIAFFEVLIWVLAVGQVLANLKVWYLAVSYAAGFASGNVVGVWLERKLAMGLELVRVVSSDTAVRLADSLRGHGYSVTEIPARGDNGSPVEVLLVVERRRRVPGLLRAVQAADAAAVCTMSDVRQDPGAFRFKGEASSRWWLLRRK